MVSIHHHHNKSTVSHLALFSQHLCEILCDRSHLDAVNDDEQYGSSSLKQMSFRGKLEHTAGSLARFLLCIKYCDELSF